MASEASATFAVLRTPLLPLDDWIAWGQDARGGAADRALLVERLRAWVERPEVREALLIASPSLDAAIGSWLSGGSLQQATKVERALVRYLTRMCTRSTPFGLFAGYSLVRVGDTTALTLGPRDGYRRQTRLDVRRLLDRRRLADDVVLAPNQTLYSSGGELRHLAVARDQAPWAFTLVAVVPTPHLQLVLERAAQGATRAELARALAERQGCGADEAAEFVDALVAQQLLEPALPLGLYGDDPLPVVAAASVPEEAQRLASAAHLLRAVDEQAVGAAIASCRELGAVVPPASGERLVLHAELYKPAALRLDRDVTAQMARAARLLAQIGDSGPHAALERFKEAFERRYEGAAVPLLLALDEDDGIGFDASVAPGVDLGPLVAALDLPVRATSGAHWAPRHAHLLRRIEALARSGERELALDDEDLTALAQPNAPALPESFGVAAKLLAPSEAAVRAGDYRVLVTGVIAGSPLAYVARHAMLDAQLLDAARAHARAEQALRPDVILADVVHVPDGRLGNIVLRPRLRDAHIDVLDRASPAGGRQLRLADLCVSVEKGRIVLRLASGEEIAPRVTSAHDARSRRSVGVYRFLCALAEQGPLPAGRWNWGPLAESAFLPRVVHRRVVLAPARWRLQRSQLDTLTGDDDAVNRAAARLRAELGLPRWVVVDDADRALAVDFENLLSVESFVQLAQGREAMTLIEMLPGGDGGECCVHGPEGRFAHELIVAFVNERAAAPTPRVRTTAAPAKPTSDWLFLKVYLGRARADELLRTTIAPFVDDARRAGLIDRWFFVRYGGPDFHLRLRFHGALPRLRDELLPRLWERADELIRAGLAWRAQLDCYVREVQRYGGAAGMSAAEMIFDADSDATLAMVDAVDGVDDRRWQAALWGCARLASDVGLSVESQAALFRRVADAFKRELDVDAATLQRLGRTFRDSRGALEALLRGQTRDPAMIRVGEALERRSAVVRDAAQRLDPLAAGGGLSVPLDEWAEALLHMHVNRMMPSSPRAHELALYDFLARLCESAMRRGERVA